MIHKLTDNIDHSSFMDGWVAGCVNGVAMLKPNIGFTLINVPTEMRMNPYDQRSIQGRSWDKGFAASLDAFQGQFMTINDYAPKLIDKYIHRQ